MISLDAEKLFSQYIVKGENKEKICNGVTLKDTRFDVGGTCIFVWGSNQRLSILYAIIMAVTVAGWIPCARKIFSIFPRCPVSKALEKST